MRKLLRLIYAGAYYLGVMRLFYWLNRRRQVVLTYHSVIPDESFDGALHLLVSCTQSAFEAQMRIVAERFATTTEVGQPGTCLVTFDDGCRNNLTVAAPILKRYGLRGLFFIPGCVVQGSGPLWNARMLCWMSYVPTGTYMIAGRQVSISDQASRAHQWMGIWEQIKENFGVVERVLADMEKAVAFAALSVPAALADLHFSNIRRAEMEGMKADGHALGGHSWGHPILRCLSDAELDEDFRRCEELLGSVYNAPVYAYPFGGRGEISPRELQRCAATRFTTAFLNVERDEGAHGLGRMTLPNSTDPYIIHARLSGMHDCLRRTRRRVLGWVGKR